MNLLLKNLIVLGAQQSAEDEVQRLRRRSSKIVSKACSLAIVGVPDTKVTILNRNQTDQNVFIYETVFANARQ